MQNLDSPDYHVNKTHENKLFLLLRTTQLSTHCFTNAHILNDY